MKTKKHKPNKYALLLTILIVFTAIFLGACADIESSAGEGNEAKSSESSEGSESGGEGSESGSEGSGEHGSGGESAEGSESGGEGSEGSAADSLMLNETYDVTKNGARLVLKYDPASNSFVGSVENTSSAVLSQVRVEIHLSNGTELGPTTRVDLAPGESIQLNMLATSQAFDTWAPHSEIGSGEGGSEGSESGGEGSEGSGRESSEAAGHAEGGEGGSERGEAGMETLMSSPVTQIAQTWNGNLAGLDVIGSYDDNTQAFTSVVTNTLSYKLCYVQTEPHMKMGANTIGELGPDMIGDLNPGETKSSVIYLANEPGMAGVQFDGYAMHMEVFDCSGPGPAGNAPTINPLTGLPGGSSEGGSEGGNEGAEGGMESGSESGSEGIALGLNQTHDVTYYGARLLMGYDPQSNSFIGMLVNTTANVLPQVRVEIHLSNGAELGPTTPVDMAPGQVIGISLPATGQAFDNWTAHAEVGNMEGVEGSGGGEGSESNHSESGSG